MRWHMGWIMIGFCGLANAHYSYQNALQDLQNTPAILAAQANYDASALQYQSLKHLGKPDIFLNVHAVHYQQHADIPLDSLNNKVSSQLNEQANTHLKQIGQLGLDSTTQAQLQAGTQALVANTLNRLPNQASFDARGTTIRPSLSVAMPIYTGGLIDASKNVAKLKQQRDSFGLAQETSLAQFELIKRYFDVQLHRALLTTQQHAYDAMQLHANNALKLEQQGFISKGQRMQFEVARNQSLHLYQNADNSHQKALFELRTLLNNPNIDTLSTPLFINTKHQLSWDKLIHDFQALAPLPQKLQTDVWLMGEKVSIHTAAQKPKVFAIGQYTLDKDHDWFVGVAANYTLFSAINQKQQVQAAKLEQQAASLNAQKATQEISNLMHNAFLEFNTAKTTHQLLQHNLDATKENLRIQRLAFQEGMGTVSGVVDAETSLYKVHSETAINAYRYVMALATLLHSTGTLSSFEQYMTLADTQAIRF